MSNRITNLLFCLLSFTIAFANPIDQQDALAKAKAFVQERGINMIIDGHHMVQAPSRNGEDANAGYYIFNSANNQGFVIVSGYDCVYPILGYSDNGHIDTGNIPEALMAFLDDYTQKNDSIHKIEQRLMEAGEQPSGSKRVFAPAKYPVKPILRRNWSYNSPYNKQLPTIGDTACNVGCTSVGLGTVIGHYSFPASSKAINGYTTPTKKIVVDPLPETDFDWDNMLDNYGLVHGTSKQQNAVAKLMRYVSQSLKADYVLSGSPAYFNDVPTALRFFNYHCDELQRFSRRSLNDNENVIYNELLDGRPVLMAGWGMASTSSGHVFIIDGYDTDDYFHIDWGWNGDSNGYFRLTNMSPYHNYMSWAYGRNLLYLTGVYPNTEDYAAPTTETKPYENLQVNKLTPNSNGTISVTVYNPTNKKNTFYYGLGIYDDNHRMLRAVANDTVTIASRKSLTKAWTIDVTDVEDGDYRIYPISKLYEGDGIWHFDICNSVNAYVAAKVTGGVATLSAGKAIEYEPMSIEHIDELKESCVGSVIGTHLGPGVVIVAFFNK